MGRSQRTGDPVPPAFLPAVAHRLRWRLLAELARSDRQVRELTRLVGQPQNLVSYHLGRLRDAGLVTARRSTADRRDAYYTVDLARVGASLAAAGMALHPGLQVTASPRQPQRGEPVVRVLFCCTGNSARSQMAEALAGHRSRGAVQAASAGSHPKPVHPNTVAVMREYGIDLRRHRSKHLDGYAGQRFDYVVSLCDRVREVCPEFPGHPELIHWSIPDPAAGGDEQETYPAFRATAAELQTRIGHWIGAVGNPVHHTTTEESP